MKAMFPVPRITESFMDAVIHSLNWNRYEHLAPIPVGRMNADYIGEGCIVELKLFENEGLLQPERQRKIIELFELTDVGDVDINLDLDEIPPPLKKALEEIVSRPLQGPIKKASGQIRQTKLDLGKTDDLGILIAVNNGYGYLEHKDFCRLLLDRVRRDTSQIDFLICVCPVYHQGDFDAYIMLHVDCFARHTKAEWSQFEKLRFAINDKFGEAMDDMMRDQLNPEFWDNALDPIQDILFESNGVSYVRRAPEVPDSRFD